MLEEFLVFFRTLEIRFNVGFLGNDVPLSMWNKDVLDNPHALQITFVKTRVSYSILEDLVKQSHYW